MAASSTRENIITAADRLFYEHGYEYTSFADVSELVGISRGNFYYHFKTKDEILEAVIERRIAERRELLDGWAAQSASPKEGVALFIRNLQANRQDILDCGCPVGTLFSELSKLGHPSQIGARQLFDVFRDWLRERFEEMGRGADADALALHVLARSQGASVIANAYPEGGFMDREVDDMLAWLDTVAEGDEVAG